jgi:signal transduction histidine kinase
MLRDGPIARVARHRGYEQLDAIHVARSLTLPLETKVFRMMIETRAPTVVTDTTSDPDWEYPETMDWVHAYIGAPIVIEDRVMGFINLYSRQAGSFTAYTTRSLLAFSHEVAVALQNAKLYERARQRTEESAALNEKLRKREQYLKSLNQLTSALNRTGDPNEILRLGLDNVLQFTQMDQGTIYLQDLQTQTLIPHVQRRSVNAPAIVLPGPDHEIVQQAQSEGRIINVHLKSEDGKATPRSIIAAPLMLGDTPTGVMVLGTAKPYGATRETTILLRAIVDQLAFATQRGQRTSQVRDQLTTVHTLYEISTAFLSQMNTGGVAFLLTRTLTDHIPRARGAALYQEGESDDWSRVRVYVSDAEDPLRARWRKGETWAGEDLILSLCKRKQHQVFISRDQRQALPILETFPSENGKPAMVYIPLVLPDRTVWGVIALMLRGESAVQGYEATLLQAIVQQGTAAITRAKLYEESQTNESQMQAILESSRDGLILMGDDQMIRYINGQALRLLHLSGSPAPWVDRPLDAFRRALRIEAPELYTWLDATSHPPSELEGGAAEQPPQHFETLHDRILELQRWPVYSDRGSVLGSLYLIREITEQRELERMREDFLHMLVHDLRNPLSNIKNALRFMADPMMEDMSDEVVEIAQTNADRILRLVNTILEIGKLESQQIQLEREPVVLAPIIKKTAQNLMLHQQSFRFETILPDEMPRVWADPSILVRVLDNLFSNASKFVPDGGIIRVTVTRQEEMAQISVYNNGPQFGPEVEKHLFQKFSTGDYESSGYGLGLAFCRLAVEAHGGEIDAVNEPEGGVTFSFTLPLYQGQDMTQNVFLSSLEDLDLDL